MYKIGYAFGQVHVFGSTQLSQLWARDESAVAWRALGSGIGERDEAASSMHQGAGVGLPWQFCVDRNRVFYHTAGEALFRPDLQFRTSNVSRSHPG